MSESVIGSKISKKKLRKSNLKRSIVTKNIDQYKELLPTVSEYCVKITENVIVVVRKNNRFEGGVEIKLKTSVRGKVDFEIWKQICSSLNVISTAKDLLTGCLGKEEETYKSIDDSERLCDSVIINDTLDSLNNENKTQLDYVQ